MKQIKKPLQKIKQTRMCMYNVKKRKNQPNKHTNNRVHTYEHSLKNAKIQQRKNCITDLAIANPKTKVITQVKVQTTNKSSDKTIVHAQSCNLQAKVYQYQKMHL